MAKKITTIEEDVQTPAEVETVDAIKDVDEVLTPVETKPEIDIDKIIAEAEERAEKRITEKLVNSLSPKEDEPATPWEKEGRTPTYEEALHWVKEEAKKDLKAEEEALKQQLKDKEEAERLSESKTREEIVKTWEQQEKELMQSGKLTAVINPNDEKDPGVQELKDFYTQLSTYNQEQTKNGGRPINNVKEFFYEHYKPAEKSPNLPINRGQGKYVNSEEVNYSHNEIRKAKSIFDLFKGN